MEHPVPLPGFGGEPRANTLFFVGIFLPNWISKDCVSSRPVQVLLPNELEKTFGVQTFLEFRFVDKGLWACISFSVWR